MEQPSDILPFSILPLSHACPLGRFLNELWASQPLPPALLWVVREWWRTQANQIVGEGSKTKGPSFFLLLQHLLALPALQVLIGRTHSSFVTMRNPILVLPRCCRSQCPRDLQTYSI